MRLAAACVGCAAISCGRIGFDPAAGARDATAAGDARGDGAAGDAPDAPPDAPQTPILVAHTIRNALGSNLATLPIDTTGATLLVAAECAWSTGTPSAPVDSAGNAWQAVPPHGAPTQPGVIRLFYVVAPATSASHVFVDPGSDYQAIAVAAYAGTDTSPTAFDAATGAVGANPVAAGSVSPAQPGELVVTFGCSGDSVATSIAIDSSFALVDSLLNGSGGAPEDLASAALVSTTTAPLDPQWSFPGDAKIATTIAAFKSP